MLIGAKSLPLFTQVLTKWNSGDSLSAVLLIAETVPWGLGACGCSILASGSDNQVPWTDRVPRAAPLASTTQLWFLEFLPRRRMVPPQFL